MVKNLRRFQESVNDHDRANPTHTTLGLALSPFDLERLGMDEGEEILPGVPLSSDPDIQPGRFRILCDGSHEHERENQVEQERPVEAVAS